MNFEPAAYDISKLMAELLSLIAGMNISPDAKKSLLVKSFGMVGVEFYNKMFNDCSELFDSLAMGTLGKADIDDQTGRLAQKLLRNDVMGRPTDQIVGGYFNSLLASAQDEAFKNAVSLDKVPTLTRSLRGETCGWCQARVGTWTNPSGELFARHDNCDCKIVVKGYNSRNGELKNYTKNSKNKGTNSHNQGDILTDEQAMRKIGVDEHYWKKDMDDGERWFAKNYPGSIGWIDRNKYDSNGKKLPTNDFVDVHTGAEYELKSPESTSGRSISRTISAAAGKGKTNFMINLKNKSLSDSLRRSLEQYNMRHSSDRQIKRLKVFTKGREVEIILKE